MSLATLDLASLNLEKDTAALILPRSRLANAALNTAAHRVYSVASMPPSPDDDGDSTSDFDSDDDGAAERRSGPSTERDTTSQHLTTENASTTSTSSPLLLRPVIALRTANDAFGKRPDPASCFGFGGLAMNRKARDVLLLWVDLKVTHPMLYFQLERDHGRPDSMILINHTLSRLRVRPVTASQPTYAMSKRQKLRLRAGVAWKVTPWKGMSMELLILEKAQMLRYRGAYLGTNSSTNLPAPAAPLVSPPPSPRSRSTPPPAAVAEPALGPLKKFKWGPRVGVGSTAVVHRVETSGGSVYAIKTFKGPHRMSGSAHEVMMLQALRHVRFSVHDP